jgi:outer membrane protein TolC
VTADRWQAAAFSAKTALAALMALWVTLWAGLSMPFWAMTTIFLVANPLSGATRSAYVSVCSENEALGLAEETLATREQIADVTRRLSAAGKISAIEVTQAQGLALEARAHLPGHQAAVRAGLYRLAFLLGRTPSEYPREAESCRALPELKRPLPSGDGAALLARRPDVRAAERLIAASTAGIGVAKADLYLRIALGLNGGTFGLLEDIGSAMSGRWAIGAMINWVFPSRTAFARVDAARADTDRSLAEFDATVLRALRETETALSWYRENHNRAVTVTQAREQAEKLTAQTRRLHEAGKVDLHADLDSRILLANAK